MRNTFNQPWELFFEEQMAGYKRPAAWHQVLDHANGEPRATGGVSITRLAHQLAAHVTLGSLKSTVNKRHRKP